MTNTEPVTHIAEVKPYDIGPDSWITPDFTNNITKIRLYGRHQGRVCTWSVLFVGPEGACRRVQGGPVEPGPYAALIPDSTVISAVRMPGDAPRTQHLVEGDLVVVRGFTFRIDDSRGRAGYDPQLVLVTD